MNDEQIKSLGQAITRQHAVAERLAARVMQMEEVNAELLSALKDARHCVGIDRDTLVDCHTNPCTGYLDPDGALAKAEYDDVIDAADAAIARAESAIETPAKVSPCAGHAVQLPDPLGLLSCTHPDCGRYEGPRSHECRAMADNACARPSICQGHAAQQDADALLARIARAIWGLRREEEDRCDMELEDMPHDHSVWKEAKAAIEAMKGGS